MLNKGYMASWARALSLGVVLLGLDRAAAQAQVVTEFGEGIGITPGPGGILWFTQFGPH